MCLLLRCSSWDQQEEYVRYLRNKRAEKQDALLHLQKENEDKLEAYLKEKRATYQEKEKVLHDLRRHVDRLEGTIATLKEDLRQLQPVNVTHFYNCSLDSHQAHATLHRPARWSTLLP